MAKKLAILSVAIICAFVVFVLVPKREFSIPIFPQPSAELPIVYDDVSDGGSSAATVRRVDSVLEFQCTLGKDTSKAAWCGLIWTLDSKNWLLVDSIVMDVFSESASELVIKIWTFDPDVTQKDSLATYRLLLKEIALRKGENHIALPFSEFYVPEFWFQQNQADKELVQRHKEHVSRFEITLGWNVERGQPMRFRFTKIAAKGVGSMELAIFLLVCVVIVVAALGFLKKKK